MSAASSFLRHRVLCALSHLGIEDANDHCHGYSEHNVFSKEEEDNENEQNETGNDNANNENESSSSNNPGENESVIVPQPPTAPPSIMQENLPPPQDDEQEEGEEDEQGEGGEQVQAPPPVEEIEEEEEDIKPYCVVNESGGAHGNFHFGDASYTQYVTIEYMYQVQGTLDLSAAALRQDVLPQLDRNIANMVLPELFAPDLCVARSDSEPLILQEMDETIISVDHFQEILPPNDHDRRRLQTGGGGGGDEEFLNHFETQSSSSSAAEASSSSSSSSLLGSTVGPSGSRVTGMSARPLDTILPGYAGVQCRSSLVPGAARCYIVRGGITLTGTGGGDGGGDLEWTIPLVQSMLEKYAYDGDQRTSAADGAAQVAAASTTSSSTWFIQPQQDNQQQQQEEETAAQRQERVDNLAAAFPSVMNVRFLSLQKELENAQPPMFGGNFPNDDPSSGGGGNRDTDVGIFSEGSKIHAISNWTWVVVSFAAVFVFIYGIFLCRRKVCCRGRRNDPHYRLQDADGYDADENNNGIIPGRSGLEYGDDSPQPSPNGGEGVPMDGRPSLYNNHATSGTRTSSSRRCPSWTRIPSSLDEESLTGSSQHLEIDEGGGTIYHQTHEGAIMGEPVVQAPTQASIISGSFVEASVTSLTTGSFEANRNNAPPPSSSFPVADNSNVIVMDDAGGMVDSDHVVEVADYSNHQQSHTLIEDIESSISTENDDDDDGKHITIFPQPLSIPSSSSPSEDTANGDNSQGPHQSDAQFDDPVQHEHHRPGLQEDNNNDPTIIAASSADGGVLHYKDSTRPPIDLNNIVDGLENLAAASFHDDDDSDFAVSVDGADEASDLSSGAGSASNSDGEGGKDSNTSGSSSSDESSGGGEGSWRAMIV